MYDKKQQLDPLMSHSEASSVYENHELWKLRLTTFISPIWRLGKVWSAAWWGTSSMSDRELHRATAILYLLAAEHQLQESQLRPSGLKGLRGHLLVSSEVHGAINNYFG